MNKNTLYIVGGIALLWYLSKAKQSVVLPEYANGTKPATPYPPQSKPYPTGYNTGDVPQERIDLWQGLGALIGPTMERNFPTTAVAGRGWTVQTRPANTQTTWKRVVLTT